MLKKTHKLKTCVFSLTDLINPKNFKSIKIEKIKNNISDEPKEIWTDDKCLLINNYNYDNFIKIVNNF